MSPGISRKIFMRVYVEPGVHPSAKEIIEDVLLTLLERGHRVDGVLYEVKSRVAYAWRWEEIKLTSGEPQG